MNTQRHTHIRKIFSFLVFFVLIVNSCQSDIDKIDEQKTPSAQNHFEVENGIVKIESKQNLKIIMASYQKDVKGQNEFNEGIRAIQDKGFKPLTPIFGENDTEKLQKFILEKYDRTQKENKMYLTTSKSTNVEEIDLDDELISDPAFAALLNEDREIIVGDSLYKYTEKGLYFCLSKDKHKLDDYLSKISTTLSTNKIAGTSKVDPCAVMLKSAVAPASQVTEVARGISKFMPSESTPCDIGPMIFPTPYVPKPVSVESTPKFIKSNLPITRIEKQGFFEKIFGTTEVDTEDYGDGKRIKVKFWNQNFFIFSSLGCSARFQKREKILGISYWEKSYARQIELGINDISYIYNYNVPVYNAQKYGYENFFIEINGIKYAGSGKQIIEFPSGASNFPYEGTSPQEITVYAFGNQYDISYDANKVQNQIFDFAVKQAFDQIVRLNPSQSALGEKVKKGEIPYKIISANPLANHVTISTHGAKWTYNDDNAITHYLDFNFLLTYKSKYDGTWDYLSGLEGSKKYDALRVDLYGAALHNNVWKGRRLILGEK
ncbi:hypothetical protein [Flavobacterium sp.]|uniref:hypothetical protein n=1 Tax=Flavobacterium sp. TaxID=239 RepID=UPI00260C35E0|nr:hypothetical protein [Flavobacterium sp.]